MMCFALAAPIACATQLFELKEHRTFGRLELFSRDLRWGTATASGCSPWRCRDVASAGARTPCSFAPTADPCNALSKPRRSDCRYYRHTTVFAEWMVLTCLSRTGSIHAQELFPLQKGFRHLAGALLPAQVISSTCSDCITKICLSLIGTRGIQIP